MDGGEAVSWCQYGIPDELPKMYHREQHEAELDVMLRIEVP